MHSSLATLRRPFDNRELSIIAMLATLHFAVSFASRMFDALLMAVTGPFFLYLSGVGDEGIPSLLLATTVVLVPRVGTAAYSLLTVWLLNGLVTGTFTLVNVQMIAASVLLHEAALAALGVSREAPWNRGSRHLPLGPIVRMALAVGLANGAAMIVSYIIFMYELKQDFATWYVSTAAIVVAGGYGAVGAGVGAAWGCVLRRTAP